MSEPTEGLTEEGLRAAYRSHRRLAGSDDEQAFSECLHPNFIINAPNNICGGREHVLKLSEGDAFANERCQSQIERAAITGNVGILMGNEIVTPNAGSLLAAWFGTSPLRRRFTETYLFEDGKWLLLARQASVVREAKKYGD
jgi:hypothetical protein